jgi:hypothetical protein
LHRFELSREAHTTFSKPPEVFGAKNAPGCRSSTIPVIFFARCPDDREQQMVIEPEELEEIPPQGHVKVVYTGPVAPHWEIHRVFGDQHVVDEFRQRAMARLQLLPVYDPQFRRNRERVARDAEREHLILEWDLGEEPE